MPTQGSINNRINILYFLDSLCETSLLAKSYPVAAEVDGAGGSATTSSFYVDYVSRDLGKIVELVVPEGRQGLPNLLSTKQVLFSLPTFHIFVFLVC
jgi:CTD kinase subunit gamma